MDENVTPQVIRNYLVQYLSRKAPLPDGEDVDAMDFIASGYVDSIGFMKFIADLESYFGISIPDDLIADKNIRTIAGLQQVIISLLL